MPGTRVYFATTAEEASELFEHRADPGALARAAYTYAHIPIVAGIILTAVGDELVLAHPVGHMEMNVAMVLAGGPAIFLLGSGFFRWMTCGESNCAGSRGGGTSTVSLAIAVSFLPDSV